MGVFKELIFILCVNKRAVCNRYNITKIIDILKYSCHERCLESAFQSLSQQPIRLINISEQLRPQVIQLADTDVVLIFVAIGYTFDDGFFGMMLGGIKLDVQFFFQGPNNEESESVGKYDTVGCGANQYAIPVAYFGKQFVKNQHQFIGLAHKKAIQANLGTIMRLVLVQ